MKENKKLIIERTAEGLYATLQTGQRYMVEFKDPKNGVTQIANRSAGIGHSAYPNFDQTGSLKGMNERYGWSKPGDDVVKAHGFYYNKSRIAISDDLDLLAYWLDHGLYLNLPTEVGEKVEVELEAIERYN